MNTEQSHHSLIAIKKHMEEHEAPHEVMSH